MDESADLDALLGSPEVGAFGSPEHLRTFAESTFGKMSLRQKLLMRLFGRVPRYLRPIAGGANRPYKVGSSSITMSGSSSFGSVNVAHGLGQDPQEAYATITAAISGALIVQFGLTGHTSTNLSVACVGIPTPLAGGNLVLNNCPAGSVVFSWLAVGAAV